MSDTVMLIGSGTREHKMAKALNASPHVGKIVWAPGNAGAYSLDKVVKGLDYNQLKNPGDYLALAKETGVQFATTGMEQYLFQGMADTFRDNGIRFFGPGIIGAELERSKALAQCYLTEWEVPTADFGIFGSASKARVHVLSEPSDKYVKVSGPALGKGALHGRTHYEASDAIEQAKKEFGKSARLLVIQDTLHGTEASDHVFINTTKGKNPVLVRQKLAKDYKRIGVMYRLDANHGMVAKNDVGLQTGGMAAYSEPSFCTEEVSQKVHDRIIRPVFNGLIERGIEYCGIMYTALIIDAQGNPRAIEINVRPGSPESEVLDYGKDIYEVMNGVIDGTLKQEDIHSADDYTVGVVLASGPIEDHPGYPEKDYKTGYRIEGLDEIGEDVEVLFGGVASHDGGKTLFTGGGRVMMLVASDKDPKKAKQKVIANAEKVRYDNKYYRDDVAHEEGV